MYLAHEKLWRLPFDFDITGDIVKLRVQPFFASMVKVMKPSARFFSLCAASLVAVPAWGQIYRCVDANEQVTYSNVASDSDKSCKRLQVEPISTIPAPKARTTPTPSDFPKMSGDEQKARDNDRRVILNQELNNEQKALQQAQKDLDEQKAVRMGNEKNYAKVQERLKPYEDKVAQHERNIQALNKELSGLK